ncbi:MAG: 2-oxoacid:acceptor oxidoreductase family protein [Oscillospiraceae bacterium]|nr:2-oxoacid:acceptor oxidoreductase family protein [Oscillospiraceae bacterium]
MANMKESMKLKEFLIAGFGGQGILFTGKLLANIGMLDGLEVTWMPSYGPAMRGGVCNCAVCISGSLIGSPVVHHPDVLICMNGPSFDKFVPGVRAGGTAYIDSSIVEVQSERTDINCQYIPATTLASENGLPNSLGIIIMLGKMIKDSGLAELDTIKKAIAESTDKEPLVIANAKAIEIGMNL